MHTMTRRQALSASLAAGLAPSLRAAALSGIKLGITTDEIDDDVAAAARFLKRFNLRWAEVRNIWGKYNTVQPVEKVREARGVLDEHGIKVSIEGTALFKVALPGEDAAGKRALDEQWALLESAAERAAIFGTTQLRIFAFTYRGDAPEGGAYGRIHEILQEAAGRAARHGLRLAIENVAQSYVWSGAQAATLLRNVKNDNLGLTWDPNNAAATGEQPFPDGYRKLDPARIFHVHLRDYRRADGKVEWAPVGGGEFDNVGQIRALLKDGYRGTFTLETHWRGPNGKAASTETSLKGLIEVIRAV